MSKWVALILILLIVIFLVLFYSPKKTCRRRIVAPAAGEVGTGAPYTEGAAAGGQEGAADEIPEVPAEAVTEIAPEPELTLDLPAVGREETPSPDYQAFPTAAVEEPEMPAEPLPAETAEAEDIPFLDDEVPSLIREVEGETEPALAGYVGEGGQDQSETPEDLARRLDMFFGWEGEAGGPAAAASAGVEAEAAEEKTAAFEVPEEGPAGLSLEEYEYGLRRLEEQLRQELARTLETGNSSKLGLVESRLTAVCGRLADQSGSLAGFNRLLEEMDSLLTEVGSALPGFQASTVRRHLCRGDGEVVRALLTETALGVEPSLLAARIRFLCGRLAEEQADFASAGELYRKACVGGEEQPEYLLAAGRMDAILGNEEAARQRLEEVLAAGGDGLVLDQARLELARILIRSEEEDKARLLLEQALAGLEQRLGGGHPALGPVLYELAALHENAGRYEEAAPLYERALAVSEQGLGLGHPRFAAILSRLAGLYEEMEREDEAEALYERALTIRERMFGPGHPDVGTLLHSLANLCKQRGEYEKAEPMFLRSLNIAEKVLGPDHPNLTVILNNLAELYAEMGRSEKAQEYQDRAFALFELPGGAGGDFVEMEKEEIAADADKEKTIAGG